MLRNRRSDNPRVHLCRLSQHHRRIGGQIAVTGIAWRLNRDAGTTSAPYRWTWSNLTPTGGNASQWRYAWTSKGWPTGTTPVVGAVAWFPYNHVAYVKAVNADGTVLIEEYNWEGKSLYGQRTIPAAGVTLYLYAPPR